jgi:solute carrier family 25 protein 33/36
MGSASSLNKDSIPQSREMGDVIPNRTPPASEEKPDAKPFTHFIAGGYVAQKEPPMRLIIKSEHNS